MSILKRYEIWLIIGACVLSLVLASGCAPAEPAPKQTPRPSREIARYRFVIEPYDNRVDIVEFRDSAGRVCVLAFSASSRMALSCARPLPPMDYEDLPPVEGEVK